MLEYVAQSWDKSVGLTTSEVSLAEAASVKGVLGFFGFFYPGLDVCVTCAKGLAVGANVGAMARATLSPRDDMSRRWVQELAVKTLLDVCGM